MTVHVSAQRATDELLSRPNLRLRIGEHVLDVGALRVVTRTDLPRLTGKAMAVLLELVRHAGNTVTRDQLLERVWAGRFTTADVLTQAVRELRRALGDDRRPPGIIETIPKVGYRLIAPVLVLDGPDAGVFVESVEPPEQREDEAAVVVAPSPRSRLLARMPWLAAALALVALAIGGAFLWHERTSASAASAPHWRAFDRRMLTSNTGAERRPHISPDGTRIAFARNDEASGFDRIVVRSLDPSQLVHLTAGSNAHEAEPAWSPDGTRIAFERLEGRGCRMSIASSLGGDEREFGTCSNYNVNYFDWTPHGRGIITSEPRGTDGALALTRIDLDSGVRKALDYERSPDDQDLEAHFSPDGKRLGFRRGIAPFSDLFVMAADGGPVRQVTHVGARIRGWTWTRDGTALVFASNVEGPTSLYVTDIESGATEPLGVSPAEYPDAALHDDGVVYEVPRDHNRVAVFSLDGSSPPRELAPSTGNDYAATLSPAGDRVVFVSDRSGRYKLWLYTFADDSAVPLTELDDRSASFLPRWSMDGRSVLAVRYDDAAHTRSLVETDVATRRQRTVSAPGENVLFGDYGIEAGTYLMVVGASGQDDDMELVSHPGTSRETRRTIARGVSYARVDRRAGAIYYTPSAGGGLFRIGIDGGDRTLVTRNIDPVSMSGWRIVDGDVWYVEHPEEKPAVFHEIDPSAGTDRIIGRIPAALRDVDFSVMPDRRSVLVSELLSEDTDVGYFRLAHAANR